MHFNRGPKSALLIAAAVALAMLAAPMGSGSTAGANPALSGPSFQYVSSQAAGAVTQVEVRIAGVGTTTAATLFLPAGAAPAAGIVFNHDGEHGVNEDVKRVCRQLADEGYVVLAPDWPSRPGSLARTQADPVVVQTVVNAARNLGEHPRVDARRIGIMGTGHGGLVSMLAVMEDPAVFRCLAQGSGAIDVDQTGRHVKIPVLLQHGWKDQVVKIDDANYLGATLRKSGNGRASLKEYRMLGNGFWFYTEQNGHNADEMAQVRWAWDDLSEFLGEQLGNSGAASSAR